MDIFLTYLFAALPILLLVLWVWLSIQIHRDPERVSTELLAGCVISVGAICLLARQDAFPDCLNTMLKIVFQVLQGDSEAFLLLVPVDSRLRGAALVLSILTPVMTAGAVFSLLCRRLPWPLLLPWKCHIFSALDDHAVMLAKSLAQKEKARFIFLRTRREDLSADTLMELQSMRFSCYPYGEIQLFWWHWSLFLRPLCMYFLTENSEENFDRMEEFLKQAQRLSFPFRWIRKREYRELYLLSETASAPMLIDYLRNKYDLPGAELRLLDRYRAASLHLMKTAPLYEARRDGPVRVLMLGMGQVGRSLYRTMASMGVIGQFHPEFHLCDQNINKIMGNLKQQYPELGTSLKPNPHELDAESAQLSKLLAKNTFDYIVVALGDDERNLRVASALYRHYRKQYWTDNQTHLPRICVNLEDEIKARSTACIYPSNSPDSWEPGFTVFGTDQEVFSSEVLLPRGLWRAARKLHKLLNKEDPEPNWCEYERRSSIAAVAHGAAHVASVLTEAQAELFVYNYTQQLNASLPALRSAEHLRWMNYVRSEGMSLATEAIWKAYIDNLGSHVDIRGQLSPCLVSTDELDTVYNNLKPHLSGKKCSFREQDELVARNADLFALLWETPDLDIELRGFQKTAP